MTSSASNVREQIANGYGMAIGRPISEAKLAVLQKLYEKTSVRISKATNQTEPANDVAMELVASAIFNLDEFITRD